MQKSLGHTDFIILPPSWRAVRPQVFKNLDVNNRRYDALLSEMQRLRGRIYAGDGAIQAQDLTPDGRHVLKVDEQSWHILTIDGHGSVTGCLRFLEEKKVSRIEDLWIFNSAMARCPVWGSRFRRAVELEIATSRKRSLSFGEVGGWAVAEERRWTMDPLCMVLATCSLFHLLGGCIGLATATLRHGSSAILRRIGLAPLVIDGVELPPYYDPQYGCQMEALRFDSQSPNPKYRSMIESLTADLANVPVICREAKVASWPDLMPGPQLINQKLPKLPSLLPAIG